MSYKGPERRKNKRIRKKFKASFQLRSHAAPEGKVDAWNVVSASDIGGGGLLIDYDGKIEIGALLTFKVNFPGIEHPINCVGKIVRVKNVPGSKSKKVAAVFTEINEQEKEMINKAAAVIYGGKEQA